ncbi:hypothetical protein D3C72_1024240 [compost metagenome]
MNGTMASCGAVSSFASSHAGPALAMRTPNTPAPSRQAAARVNTLLSGPSVAPHARYATFMKLCAAYTATRAAANQVASALPETIGIHKAPNAAMRHAALIHKAVGRRRLRASVSAQRPSNGSCAVSTRRVRNRMRPAVDKGMPRREV